MQTMPLETLRAMHLMRTRVILQPIFEASVTTLWHYSAFTLATQCDVTEAYMHRRVTFNHHTSITVASQYNASVTLG